MHKNPPLVQCYAGISVARDDLYPGGTKARVAEELYRYHDEIVYAGAAQSVAQIALALVGKKLNKKSTIFVARRAQRTPETQQAIDFGANIVEITPGYLSVVKARATVYCQSSGAWLAPLGFNTQPVIDFLADVAVATKVTPDEVWCAAGSGTLTRALQQAFPEAEHHAVLFGKESDVGLAIEHKHHLAYSQPCKTLTPFPCHPTFDAKAWEVCIQQQRSSDRSVFFWNVASS